MCGSGILSVFCRIFVNTIFLRVECRNMLKLADCTNSFFEMWIGEFVWEKFSTF